MQVGTVENAGAAASGQPSGGVSSGTASEALIKAAQTSLSSGEGAPGASGTGDTAQAGAQGTGAATSGATGQPSAQGQPDATGNRGEAPESRIQAAVRNARQEYAWAQELLSAGLKPQDVKAAISLVLRLRENPRQFWTELGTELGGDRQEDTVENYPDPDLATQDGRVTAYSHASVLKALEIQERKLTKLFQQQMQPLLDAHGRQLTAEKQAQIEAHNKRVGDSALAEARKFPHFKENEALIAEKLLALPEELRDQVGPVAAMFIAYNQVISEKVLPGFQRNAETAVREDNRRKAATTGSVHPNGPQGDAKKPELRNVTDLAAHMERLSAQMSQA